MEFENSPERQEYLKTRGKIVLNACPGSGKTTTIAYKLIQLIEESNRDFGDYAGIICLSFTNVAKDEINEKFKVFTGKLLSFPNDVSTIDSFIYSYITKPFVHLIDPTLSKVQIVDESDVIDDILRGNYQLLRRHSKYLFKYKPSSVEFKVDGTTFSTIGGDGKQAYFDYCNAVKTQQLSLGLLKSSDSEYFALQILNSFPRIGEWLAMRFPYLIIDEAQDTSEIQHAIFDKLIELGLKNIEFVGDPYQSLYEFRDARPDLFYAKYKDKENWNCLELMSCRRSSQTIINTYQKLRLETEKEISSTAKIKNEKEVHVLRYNEGEEIKCVEKYIELIQDYKNCQVVVRGKKMQKLISGEGISNINPWKSSIPYYFIRAINCYHKNDIKSAVNILRVIVPEIEEPHITKLESRARIIELRSDSQYNAQIMEVLKGAPSFENTLEVWTSLSEAYIKKMFSLNHDIDFAIKKGQWTKQYKVIISDLFDFKDRSLRIPVSTIHQVKGKTFDSILIILSPTSQGQNISLSDYGTPEQFPGEKKRMIYVAMSRPVELIAIGVPNAKYSDDEVKDIFDCDIKIVTC
ncbi:MAG: ATP-dependent helicase [Flavobacterium sp.]|nr:MAG: ATP-dependent helicase [Flavobacterium sp.]